MQGIFRDLLVIRRKFVSDSSFQLWLSYVIVIFFFFFIFFKIFHISLLHKKKKTIPFIHSFNRSRNHLILTTKATKPERNSPATRGWSSTTAKCSTRTTPRSDGRDTPCRTSSRGGGANSSTSSPLETTEWQNSTSQTFDGCSYEATSKIFMDRASRADRRPPTSHVVQYYRGRVGRHSTRFKLFFWIYPKIISFWVARFSDERSWVSDGSHCFSFCSKWVGFFFFIWKTLNKYCDIPLL